MANKLTTEEFIRRAKEVHGDKYDYSKVEYVNNTTKVCIICPTHGEFWQKPNTHIQKKGCKKCFLERKRSLVCGKGINDCINGTSINGKHTKCYSLWKAMLERCYNKKHLKRYPTYEVCTVCDEWLLFSNFKKWFDKNYKEGYHLDKDILVQGNKIYSPNTCAFIPAHINTIICDSSSKRGEYKIGVTWCRYHNKFSAHAKIKKREKFLGYYKDEESAFNAYKKAKSAEIRRVAKESFNRNEINKDVYMALLRFKIG